MKDIEELKVYKAKDVQAILGISESAYYRLVNKGLLPYTRLTPGGDRVHLLAHLEIYREYLLSQTKSSGKKKAG